MISVASSRCYAHNQLVEICSHTKIQPTLNILYISTNSNSSSIVFAQQRIFLSCCCISYSIMHVWLALFSIVVKFNSVKSLQSDFWEGKTSAKWSHHALRTIAEPGFTWCVPQLVCVRLAPVCVCLAVQKPWLTPSALPNVLSLKSYDH